MNPFAWLKPRSATVAELEQQLAGAREALELAQASTFAAQQRFDDSPDDSALKQLGKARDLEAGAREHHARAERLLVAAREREAKERRAALEKRQAELQAELAHHQLIARRQPALDQLVAGLVAAIEAESERAKVETGIGELEQELDRVRVALGGTAVAGPKPDNQPSRVAVAESLSALLQRYPDKDPRRELVHALVEAFGGLPFSHYLPPAREAAE